MTFAAGDCRRICTSIEDEWDDRGSNGRESRPRASEGESEAAVVVVEAAAPSRPFFRREVEIVGWIRRDSRAFDASFRHRSRWSLDGLEIANGLAFGDTLEKKRN